MSLFDKDIQLRIDCFLKCCNHIFIIYSLSYNGKLLLLQINVLLKFYTQYITYSAFTKRITTYNKPMRVQDNFNIITGEVRTHYPSNSTSKRFASMDLIKNQKKTGGYDYAMPPVKKLGHARDQKMFSYNYTGGSNDLKTTDQFKQKSAPNLLKDRTQTLNSLNLEKYSLVNASKLPYNLINNTIQPTTSLNRNWTNTKRKYPISKFSHQGRTFAPNYTNGYGQKLIESKNQYSRKRNLCSEVCEVQKTYGTQKFFRKYK